MDTLLRMGGWLWTGFAALVGLACLAQGMGLAAVLFFLSAGAATPPLWRFLREKGVGVPLAARVGVGAIFFVVASFSMPPQPTAQQVAQGERTEPEASGEADPAQNEGGLASLERKIGADAVIQMDRENFSNTYNRLGRAQFDNANNLARWAAIAAAESDNARRSRSSVSRTAPRDRHSAGTWIARTANGS
jgi:hypothetical protein